MKKVKILLIMIAMLMIPFYVKGAPVANPNVVIKDDGGGGPTQGTVEEDPEKNNVNATEFIIDYATIECVYDNGYSIMYDGKKMTLTDNGNQGNFGGNSLSIASQYLLGGTDYLKNSVFSMYVSDPIEQTTTNKGFRCPEYLYESQLLNGNSSDESKSYSKYFFAANSKPDKYTQYNYLYHFVLQVMKDNGWSSSAYDNRLASDSYFTSKAESGGWHYTDCGYSRSDTQKECTLNILLSSNTAFKNSLQLEDLIGVGYATNIGNTTHTVTSGWWFWETQSEEKASKFFGYSSSADWASMSQLQRFIESQTSISKTSKLVREKIFVEKDQTPLFTCSYMSEADQTISAKQYMSVEYYTNGMILVSGNNGTTSGGERSDNKHGLYNTLKNAYNYASCPSTIYVKAPFETVNYEQENPTKSYNASRYDVRGTSADGYVKMKKLAAGTYFCKKVDGKYYDGDGNLLIDDADGTAEVKFKTQCTKGVDVCAEYLPKTTQYLKQVISWISFLVPVYIAVLIMIDFVKCIIANSNEFEDKHKRKLKHIKTRIFILILFLLLRPIINIVLSFLYGQGILQVSDIDCLFF